MINKPLKQFLIFLTSIASVITLTVIACSGGDWTGQEGSMFTPEIIQQPKYAPFFRTIAYPFYGDTAYDDAGAQKFEKINCEEWKTYFNQKVSDSCLYYWLYEASLKQVDSMVFAIKDKPSNLSSKSKKYSLKTIVPGADANAFLYYLGFAKRNEEIAVKEETYSWEPVKEKIPTVSVVKQIAGGLNFFSKASNPFFKERYAFQLMRLYFFNAEYDKAIEFYNTNEALFSSGNSMKWRSLGYKAAALYKQKKYTQSNYIYSIIYDNYSPLKRSAYLSYHPIFDAEFIQCLNATKNTREKEVLWQLQGLYTNYVKAIQEIVNLNPKSDIALLLITRAVNIEEEKRNSYLYEEKPKDNAKIYVETELLNLMNALSDENKTNNPLVCHLAAAYLNYLNESYSTADMQLKRASKYLSNNRLAVGQYHIVSLFGKLSRAKKINPEIEKELLTDLQVIFAEDLKNTYEFRREAIISSARQLIATWYKQNYEFEKAELVSPGINYRRFASTEPIQKMIDYYDNPNKTDFEKLFLNNAFNSKADYQELLAIRYAQNDQLEKALQVFKTIPNYSITLYGNPFTIHIKDCHDCDHEAPQKTKYTKTSFIEKMIEMKQIAQQKPTEAAQNYFLIANGFYNMTYFGNARLFYDNRIDNTIYDYDHTLLEEEKSDLALKYYLLARDKSTDKEFKAKCTFMAAKCEQNNFFMNMPKNYDGDFKAGYYFAELKKDYSKTKYYSEIIRECSYFKTYVNK